MIEFIILGMFTGVGFIAYQSNWLDKFTKSLLEAESKREKQNVCWYFYRIYFYPGNSNIFKSKRHKIKVQGDLLCF